MTARTDGTQVAALEAARNEALVRAEGSLIGERRAAIARVAMVVMFAIVTSTGDTARHPLQPIIGAAFLLWSIAALVGMHRAKPGTDPARTRWRPLGLTLIDFAFITCMSLLSQQMGASFSTARHAIASAIVISFAVSRRGVFHVVYSVGLALASLLGLAANGQVLGDSSTWFVMGGFVVLGVMIAMTNRALGTMFQGLRQRDNLTRFLPRQVADRIIAAGPGALAPVEREVTVLFSDIRGFTSMSEGLSPREVLAMLDDYFARMSAIVKGHDGVVGKFLGDGLLAFWGVPDRLDDHAAAAVRAARDMQRAVTELNVGRVRAGLLPLRIGIGIHTGPVAAGMLGGALQAEYTVIGDAVNVASRVEGLTKEHGVDTLISETTRAGLRDPDAYRRVATAEIRGRREPVTLYTLA